MSNKPEISFELEQQLWQKGIDLVCGVDEAGRGPLAGPVVAAAVILPQNCILEGLNDSKKLTEKKREILFDQIQQKAVAFSIVSIDHKTIDEINILQATMRAMKQAVEGLAIQAQYVLIDGNQLPELTIPANTVVKGDALSYSIAAASILAKVTRDRYMCEMEQKYQGYGFAKHKGYGTKAHNEAIVKLGVCEIHRKTFLKKLFAKHPEVCQ